MKGQMISQFKVGDYVSFPMKDKSVKTGTICKFYTSGSHGAVKIKPSDGTPTISRRLQHVSKNI